MPVLPSTVVAELRALPVLADAACRDHAGLWDGDQLDGEDLDDRDDRLRLAVRICHRCEARRECAQLVASYGPLDTYGVWAGRVHYGRDRRPRSARAV